MAWRPHSRAYVNPSAPQAWGICDRCSFTYLHSELTWQYQWAGPNLQNLRFLVCRTCLDTPQPQLKPRILPPDPMPVMNARPENYDIDDMDWIVTQDEVVITTQAGVLLVQQDSANQRLPAV